MACKTPLRRCRNNACAVPAPAVLPEGGYRGVFALSASATSVRWNRARLRLLPRLQRALRCYGAFPAPRIFTRASPTRAAVAGAPAGCRDGAWDAGGRRVRAAGAGGFPASAPACFRVSTNAAPICACLPSTPSLTCRTPSLALSLPPPQPAGRPCACMYPRLPATLRRSDAGLGSFPLGPS